MTFKTLAEIQTDVKALAKIIGASESGLPTYGTSADFARPHIEVDQNGYHYVVVERGIELSRTTTRQLDELLYIIFEDVTEALAIHHVTALRVDMHEDSRRAGFRHQIELLSALSPQWAKRRSQEIEQILKRHPYDDLGSVRAILIKELRDQGYSPDEARQIGRDKYPLPK